MDEQLFFLINSNHTIFWDSMMYCISQKMVWIPFYLSIVYVILRNYSWKELTAVLLMIGCGMLITDWGNAHLLRPWIGRLRPSNPENPISSLVHIVNGRRGAGCGFPSAHSANIWLLTFIVCYWLRNRLIVTTMPIVALLVCYSRVYLGYHYPGDILGGLVLAAIVAWIAIMIQQRCTRCLNSRISKRNDDCRTEICITPLKGNLRECAVVPGVVILTIIAFYFVSVG